MSGPTSPDNSPRMPRRSRFELEPLTDLSGNSLGGLSGLNNGNGGGDGSRRSTRSNSPEPLHTPTLGESYTQLRKNLSFKSLRDLEMRLSRSLGTKVFVRDKAGRGEVALPYTDLDMLDRILAKLLK